MSGVLLSKFDAAERQLIQAIILFFNKADSVSIHTIAEAANQVLSDLAGDYELDSFIRNPEGIKPENMKAWRRDRFKSRNFFKHADKDKDEKHNFLPEQTIYSLLDSIGMHKGIKQSWIPETFAFYIWFSTHYSDLLVEDSDSHKIVVEERSKASKIPPIDYYLPLLDLITKMRKGEILQDKVTLKEGL